VILTENNFKEGELIICILNNRANLTVGKEYLVSYSGGSWVEVTNDENDEQEYHFSRFLPKSEWRNFTIDQILEK
jgi:hypothetical protein